MLGGSGWLRLLESGTSLEYFWSLKLSVCRLPNTGLAPLLQLQRNETEELRKHGNGCVCSPDLVILRALVFCCE